MNSDLIIREDRLDGPEVIALLEQHLALMALITPPESIHALDLNGLKSPEVTAWTAWGHDKILGCGALKELDPFHGEIKSMHTAEAARGKGVGSALLQHVVSEAKSRGYRRLSLETGTQPEFKPARLFYENHGFGYCSPFADYTDDPNSAYMTLDLSD